MQENVLLESHVKSKRELRVLLRLSWSKDYHSLHRYEYLFNAVLPVRAHPKPEENKLGWILARQQQFSDLRLAKDVARLFQPLQQIFCKLCSWKQAGESCKKDVSLPWQAFFLRTTWIRSYASLENKLVICKGQKMYKRLPGQAQALSPVFLLELWARQSSFSQTITLGKGWEH